MAASLSSGRPRNRMPLPMRRLPAVLAVLLAALPAAAQDAGSYVAQVPLLPLSEGAQPDVDALAADQWPAYWRAAGAGGFGRDDLRAGRVDLDGDGEAELVLMIASEAWQDDKGLPLVIAAWGRKAWRPVAFARGDTDSVFTTREVVGGWRTIDTGADLLRWNGKGYRVEARP